MKLKLPDSTNYFENVSFSKTNGNNCCSRHSKYLLLAIVFLVNFAGSCNKLISTDYSAKHNNGKKYLSIIENLSNYDALIHFNYSDGLTQPGAQGYAQFKNSSGEFISAGKLYLNQTEVLRNSSNQYSLANNYFSSGGSFNPLIFTSGLFGNTMTINITGDSFGYTPFDTIVNVPPIITGVNYTAPSSRKLNVGQSVTLQWVGLSQPSNNLFLQMTWKKDMNNRAPGKISSYSVWITDIGSFTIPWSVWSQFDTSGYVSLSLHRYGADEFLMNGKKLAVITQHSKIVGDFLFN